MKLNIKTTADGDFDGLCPECHEHTTAGDSCCGRGAYVEGGLVTDESVQERHDNPTVCIRLAKDLPYPQASDLKSALFKAGISATCFGNDHKWNINIFVDVDSINQYK